MRVRNFFFLLLLTFFSLGGYLVASWANSGLGFPLDDAWIHQTYARNLALLGEWSFIPGKPSAGSTSPLWTVLLSLGHYWGSGPYFWTYIFGWAILYGLALLSVFGFKLFVPKHQNRAIWAGVLISLEWHLVWAAGSGMETLLFGFMVTMVLLWIVFDWKRWFWLGVLIGLSGWIRPDGITLLGPVLLYQLMRLLEGKGRLKTSVYVLLGFFVLFIPFLGFNQILSGAVWPNTFYAKQAEYATLTQTFLGKRLAVQFSLPLVGAGFLLLPGSMYFINKAWKGRRWGVLAGTIWWIGYVGLYAWRLPVTYQHGRYLMPAMPIFLLWGIAGLFEWVNPNSNSLLKRVFGHAWTISTGLVLLIFWGQGLRAYARDVDVIESEMVATARWVSKNTPPDVLIAAHDIGALGYFGDRELIDLAGLVSPEVIPFIRDESRLRVYLTEKNADYLVTFENWYPYLEENVVPIYKTEGEISPLLGGTNMVVYRWNSPQN